MAGNGSPSRWNSGHASHHSLTQRVSSHEAADGQTDIATSAAGTTGISNVGASHQFPVLDTTSQHFDDPPYVPPRTSQAELPTYPALDPRVLAVTTYPSNQHANLLVAPSQRYPYDGVASPSDSIETWSTSSSSSASQDYLVDHAPQFSHAPLPQRNTTYYPAYEGQHRHGLEHIRYGGYPSNTGGSYYRPSPQGSAMISPEVFDPPVNYPTSTSSQTSVNQAHTLFTSLTSGPLISDMPVSTDPTGTYLRQQLGLSTHQAVSLWSLPEPLGGEKPTTPLPMLVKLAIYGSPKKQLTLQEIYTELENRFQWFRDHKDDRAWKNSIRHNLSLNKVFVHVPRPITEPGKGSYWRLDVSGGEGYKRTRKRRPKNKQVASEEEDEETSEMDEDRPGSSHLAGSRSTSVEDANIDPELRGEGHVVGEGHTRSATRRAGAGGGSPYPQHSPRYQQGPLPVVAGGQDASVERAGSGQPPTRFGQPSFGQASFPAFGQTQASPVVAPSSSPSTSSEVLGMSFSAMAMAQTIPTASRSQAQPGVSSSYNRNMQLAVQPAQWPGVEYATDATGPPTARRVGATFSAEQSAGNVAAASPGSTSSSTSGSSRTRNAARTKSRAQG